LINGVKSRPASFFQNKPNKSEASVASSSGYLIGEAPTVPTAVFKNRKQVSQVALTMSSP